MEEAKAKFKEVVNGARDDEIKEAQARVEQFKVLVAGARKSYNYRLDKLHDFKDLYAKDSVSKQKVEAAQASVDSALANLKSIEQQYKGAKARLDLIIKGATNEKIRIAQSNVDKAKAQIELLKYKISQGDITAPVSGTVETVNYKVGELVSVGRPMISLIDLDNLWVKFYIPEKKLHKVSLNQEVRLSCDSVETKVKGRVIHIASQAEFTPKNVESKESKEEMVFEVKVRILDSPNTLKPGMLVDLNLDGDL